MFPRFVVLSLLFHGALCALVVVRARTGTAVDAGERTEASEVEPFVAEGRFAGEQFDVALLDQSAAEASEPPTEASEPTTPEAPHEPTAAPTQAHAPEAPTPSNEAHAAAEPSGESAKPAAKAPSAPSPRPTPRAASPRSDGERTAKASEGEGARALYGAAGEAGVVDLATAFVRGFPQVASVDAAWAKVAPGALPTVVIELDLSEQGRVIGHRVQGAQPPFDRSIRRTLALLGQRPFTAKGRTTRLLLRGTVRSGAVSDAELGAVFAIGASYSQGAGHAFFSFASGTRVDLEVSGR